MFQQRQLLLHGRATEFSRPFHELDLPAVIGPARRYSGIEDMEVSGRLNYL